MKPLVKPSQPRLAKPAMLKPGDKIATVSLSWGGAGDPDILWRYQLAKERLETQFGFEVVEMPHTLKDSEFLYKHPEKRADDLMAAFNDPTIKGIFSCIGGDDSVRMLPHIDFEVIANNPKVVLGYSDTTVTHWICQKAGLSSFYGPAILSEFGENIQIFDYTVEWFKRTLMNTSIIGEVLPSAGWTGERIEWLHENRHIQKALIPNTGYEMLSGKNCGKVSGHLIGGCMEVLEIIKGTTIWPELTAFDGALLFLETSEEMPAPEWVFYWLRNYAAIGILHKINGILFAKPYQGTHQEAYHKMILKVLQEEGLVDLPVMVNMSFGHNEPMMCLPIGAMAEMDTNQGRFSILESGMV